MAPFPPHRVGDLESSCTHDLDGVAVQASAEITFIEHQ
jgi:hypothetical protein